QQPIGDLRLGRRRRGACSERAWHGADTAVRQLGGYEGGEQRRETIGVGNAGIVAPIGGVDLLLHPRSVEGTEGESVDREDVEFVGGQEGLQLDQRARDRERFGRRSGQAETDAKASAG